MWWIVGLLLMGVFGRALAQDTPGGSEQMEAENARRISDQAIVKFNTDIADFPSWELFEAVALAQVTPGLLGTCYTYQGGTVHVIMDPLPRAEKATVWQQTDGKGWQQTHTDYDSSSPPSRPISREHEVSRERRQPMSTILVVDDSPTALKLVSKALATAGHHIIMASNGEEAVAKATDAHPDLVVLDVIMPHKNGYQVCRQLKNDAKTHDIKIILCTRQNQQADHFWGMQQGADAYLAKPFDEAELLATVTRFLP